VTPNTGLSLSFDAGKIYHASVFTNKICGKGNGGARTFLVVKEGDDGTSVEIRFGRYVRENVSLSILVNYMDGCVYVFEWCHCLNASIEREN
jgi:hypothetical protein